MAEEGASSSSNSFDELYSVVLFYRFCLKNVVHECQKKKGKHICHIPQIFLTVEFEGKLEMMEYPKFLRILRTHPNSSGFTSQMPNDSCTSVSSSGSISCMNPGMIGGSRLSYNPFAIKTATPTRSLADSTESKESRPLVAPPTLKLGINDSSCGISSSAPKVVLRPSALTAQAELLKLMNKHESGFKQDDKENKLSETNAISREANSVFPESNGKIPKSELFSSGITSSNDSSPKSLPSKLPKLATAGGRQSAPNSDSSEEAGSDGGSFVFGQNLHERALNYEDTTVEPLSPTDSHNLSFEEAALRKEELDQREREAHDAKLSKSLSESAKEYESKQIKRKFDEVTVITGEEEESNVLQMNCKLFAFNKVNSSWQERGRGILRLNDKEVNGILQSRVVMRTQGSLRVILNTKVWSGMSVEHPSPKTVRLTAIDVQGIRVFLVMANPKDAEQLFSALDWRVTSLKSREDSSSKTSADEAHSVVEEATSSSGLPDTSSNEYYDDHLDKRPKLSLLQEGGADSSTEMSYLPGTTSEISSDSLVDSTDLSNTPQQENADDCSSLVSD